MRTHREGSWQNDYVPQPMSPEERTALIAKYEAATDAAAALALEARVA